jgi:hypothetical protein
MEMTAEINSIPTICYINQCAREIRMRPTSYRCSMMSIIEDFDPKLYIPATSSQQTRKKKHMVAI